MFISWWTILARNTTKKWDVRFTSLPSLSSPIWTHTSHCILRNTTNLTNRKSPSRSVSTKSKKQLSLSIPWKSHSKRKRFSWTKLQRRPISSYLISRKNRRKPIRKEMKLPQLQSSVRLKPNRSPKKEKKQNANSNQHFLLYVVPKKPLTLLNRKIL